MKCFKVPLTWTDSLAQPKQWRKDVKFGTWNVRSFCRVGTIKSVVGELEEYKLDLVGIQEVGRGGISNSRQLYVFLWKREC
jgi:hypothetical protein